MLLSIVLLLNPKIPPSTPMQASYMKPDSSLDYVVLGHGDPLRALCRLHGLQVGVVGVAGLAVDIGPHKCSQRGSGCTNWGP